MGDIGAMSLKEEITLIAKKPVSPAIYLLIQMSTKKRNKDIKESLLQMTVQLLKKSGNPAKIIIKNYETN